MWNVYFCILEVYLIVVEVFWELSCNNSDVEVLKYINVVCECVGIQFLIFIDYQKIMYEY